MGFRSVLWILLISGKLLLCTAGSVTERRVCANKVFTLNCEALEKANQITELKWQVRYSHSHSHRSKPRILVAYCNDSLEHCNVDQVKASVVAADGIKVLSISKGTLTIERLSRKATSRTVEFRCEVQTPRNAHSHRVKVDLSLQCIWTQVGADVNLTRHLINMLPWKQVHKVEFMAGHDGESFAYCNPNRGCLLIKRPDPPPAIGNRLKETHGSILLTRIQECDDLFEIKAKVQWKAMDLSNGRTTAGTFHTSDNRSNYTLRIHVKTHQGRGPDSTPSTATQPAATQLLQGPDSALEVQTESGAVVGNIKTLPHGKSVHEYLGIPYAEPPVGELRFTAPKPANPWSGIKEAREFGAACPQPEFPIPNITTGVGEENEDCLYLNVFVPSTIKPDDKMAVMVWIHGGGFTLGSSTEYPGHVLAAFNDVIVVTFNYRLGILGFLNVPDTDVKGNYGMFDQVLAMKWVQANIARFGGNPNRVTIFGESAGGMAVSLHLISPSSQGLFQRAIMQSGAASSPYVGAEKVASETTVKKVATLANCPSGGALIRCLRNKSAEEIISLHKNMSLSSPVNLMEITGPVVDGVFLSSSPQKLFKHGKFNRNVDVIKGFTSDEAALGVVLRPGNISRDGATREEFETSIKSTLGTGGVKNKIVEDMVRYQYTDHDDPHNKTKARAMLINFENDFMVFAPTMFEAKALAKAGSRVYLYVFEHRPDFSPFPLWAGAVHGVDISFLFGAPFKSSLLFDLFAPRYSEIEKGFSLYVMKLWTDFAKFGSPTSPGSNSSPITWRPYTKEEQFYLALGVKPRLGQKYRARKISFWNNLIPRVTKQARRRKMARKP